MQRNAFDTRQKDAEWVLASAREMASEDLEAEEAARGWLPPCNLCEPLGGGGYSKEEYAMMERDRGKYLLYAAALREAVKVQCTELLPLDLFQLPDLSQVNSDESHPLVVMVPGCGRGRLVQFVLDAVDALNDYTAPAAVGAAEIGMKRTRTSEPRKVHVYAVDANPIATAHCRSRFGSNERVTIVGPLAIDPGMLSSDVPAALKGALGRCDLIVAELLGSFADNEFMCAVTQTLRRLFLKTSDGVLIPSDFSCYLAPAHCPRAHNLLRSFGRSLQQPYIMSLTEGDVLYGELQPVWSYAPTHLPSPRFEGTIEAQLNYLLAASPASSTATTAATLVEHNSNSARGAPSSLAAKEEAATSTVDGLVGFFTSTLYKDYQVDSRPKLYYTGTSSSASSCGSETIGIGRNAMHWEAVYFPLQEPLTLPKDSSLKCTVAQVTGTITAESSALLTVESQRSNDKSGEFVAAASDEMWYEWTIEAVSTDASGVNFDDSVRRGGGRQHSINLGSYFVPKGSDIPTEDGKAPLQLAMLRQNAERWKHSYLPAANEESVKQK